MHSPSLTPTTAPTTFTYGAAESARRGDAVHLAAALQASRDDTLATFAALEHSLEGMTVPLRETLNPPLWELGHIGWFQEYWISRNPQRRAGFNADPAAQRTAGVRAQADALYDSSRIPHATRWTLPLPDADATRADLARQLGDTLVLLNDAAGDDASLYFFRLVLMHEDMHHEAALYMARSLGLEIADARWRSAPAQGVCAQLAFDPGPWLLGRAGEEGFAFDNELAAQTVQLRDTVIDSRVLCWGEYLDFAQAGGYSQPRWWGAEGGAWLAAQRLQAPRYLRRRGEGWQQSHNGQWGQLDLEQPACHLTAYEAQAWCRWAGRRMPTEAEWERAAISRPGDFQWGQVWEWTASTFEPYPGFAPHPYLEYSAPWFGNRIVLRGASFMTQPRMHHPQYRNFFLPHRNDVAAGFRTCRA